MIVHLLPALTWRLISNIIERRREARRQTERQAVLAQRIQIPAHLTDRPNVFTAMNSLRMMNIFNGAGVR